MVPTEKLEIQAIDGGARGFWSWYAALDCRQSVSAGLVWKFLRSGSSGNASETGSMEGWVPLTHKGHCRVSSGPILCPTSCAAMATLLAVNNSANSNSEKGDRLRMPTVYIETLENSVIDLKGDDPTP